MDRIRRDQIESGKGNLDTEKPPIPNHKVVIPRDDEIKQKTDEIVAKAQVKSDRPDDMKKLRYLSSLVGFTKKDASDDEIITFCKGYISNCKNPSPRLVELVKSVTGNS